MSAPLFGPWERRFWEIYDSKGNRVCDVMQHGNLDERCDLIAAAPELLEACKQFVSWWEHSGKHNFTGAPHSLFDANAAIAKAEGRQ